MDIRTIQTFYTIVKTGSFQAAAKELSFVQSTVTAQIQKLESALELKLFERGKRIKLTPAGELFFSHASQLLKAYDQAQLSMSEFKKGDVGFLKIGVSEPIASYRFPKLLQQFKNRYPKVQIDIVIQNSYLFNTLVSEREIDFAICAAPESSLETRFKPYGDEPIVLLVYKGHPLASKSSVKLKDIQSTELLITGYECPFRKKIEKTLHESGATPYKAIEVGNMEAMKYYVQVGYGIAFVPLVTVSPLPPLGTLIKEIDDVSMSLVIGELTRGERQLLTPVARNFLQFLGANLYTNKTELFHQQGWQNQVLLK